MSEYTSLTNYWYVSVRIDHADFSDRGETVLEAGLSELTDAVLRWIEDEDGWHVLGPPIIREEARRTIFAQMIVREQVLGPPSPAGGPGCAYSAPGGGLKDRDGSPASPSREVAKT